jgi:SAM-dependent methyltransferase
MPNVITEKAPKAVSVGAIFQYSIDQLPDSKQPLIMHINYGDNFDAFWHQSNESYDLNEYFNLPNDRESQVLRDCLQLKPANILDVGAGSGRISLWLQEYNTDVTAVEVDSSCVNLCRNRGVETIYHKSFVDTQGFFDLVIFMNSGLPSDGQSVNLIGQTRKFLSSLFSKVSQGGFLLIEVVNDDSAAKISNAFWKVGTYYYSIDDLVSEKESYIYPHRSIIKSTMEELDGVLEKEWLFEFPSFQNNVDDKNYFSYTLWKKIK